MSINVLFNNEWEFTKQAIDSNTDIIMDETSEWKKVDLPHDWVIYDTALFNESSEGWYRNIPATRSFLKRMKY